MPPYCLGMGLADLYVNDKMVNACTADPLTELICKEMSTFAVVFIKRFVKQVF